MQVTNWRVLTLVLILVGLVAGGGFMLWQRSVSAVTYAQAVQQAQIGGQLFQFKCSTCHGVGGNGAGNAPVLNDGAVLKKYSTVSALVSFIKTNMPASDPGSLTLQQATDLALYIRSINRAPLLGHR